MANLIKTVLVLTGLFTSYFATQAFSPLEFLQHLQQQQSLQQQLFQQQQQQKQQQIKSAPQPLQQPVRPAEKPTDIAQPQEIFKPFNGKCPLMIKGSFSCAHADNNEDIPSFRVYFKGKETRSDKEGFFSITVDEGRLEKYTLVFTKYPQTAHYKQNTLKGLTVLPNMNSKCFTYHHIGNQWIPQETKIDPKNLTIPDDAIIVLIDPKYVDHLDTWNLNLNNNFIQLPRIILNTEIKNKPIERASAKSLLSSLDATPFHEEVYQEVKKPSKKVEISLAQ